MADKKYLKDEDKEKFFLFIDRQIHEAPVVKNYHGKWKELIAWGDGGQQFSEWDADLKDIKPVALKKRKKRVVINLMKPLGEAVEGKINFNHQLNGTPNSTELEDVESSKVATKLLGYNDYVNGTEELFEQLKYDLIRTGNACMKWTWDTNAFGFIKNEKGGSDTKQEGEIIGVVPSIFNVRPDPTARTREQMRWFIEVSEISDDVLIETFGLKEGDLDEQSDEAEGKYSGMNEHEEDKDRNEKTHIVSEYWEKKSSKYPEGRYIITTGSNVLYQGPNPALGEIPYFMFQFKRFGNSVWGTGPYFHIQDIQREFNRMVSIISEHIEGWRAKMIVPPGSILKEGSFTTDSFELLEVDTSRGEPHPASMPELSPQVTAWRDFLISAVDKVSNVHEVSYAQLPQYASRAPASLYSMMLEQENLKLDPMLKRINKTIVNMGKLRLRLMDKYYKYPRLTKIIGKNQVSGIEYFKGSDLNGNFDVRLSIGVSLYQSKSVQQTMVLQLFQNGIIQDRNKILKMLALGDIEEDIRGDVSDEARAIRENQAFINGTYERDMKEGGVFVYLHDNDEVHLVTHTNLAKSEEAQRWDDKKWKALDGHIMQHFQKIQILQQMGQQGQGQPGQTAQSPAAGPETPSAADMESGAGGGMGGGPMAAAGGNQTPEVAQQRKQNLVS